ncbi:MAG: hypothetical protein ACFFCY_13970 [Promethearchaeota archaeon]
MIKKINKNNLQNDKDLLYTEWVPAGRFIKFTMLFVFILITSLALVFTAVLPIEVAFVGLILGAVSVLIFLMYWNYRGLKIIITKNQIEVGYGIFNQKRIPLNNIIGCDITKARFRTYGGVGVRYGLDGSAAYNTDFGEAIKLTFKKGRPFLFSTRNPEKICYLINDLSNFSKF